VTLKNSTATQMILKLVKERLWKAVSGSASFSSELGDIERFHDVTVVPYIYLCDKHSGGEIHQGGPVWPNWNKQYLARFSRDGHPVDTRPASPGDVQKTIDDLAIWGGPIAGHFGHDISDFSTRLLQSKLEFPEAKFLFSSKPELDVRQLSQTPKYFQEMLDWFDIQPEQTVIVSEPCRVHTLLVAQQAEQNWNMGPSEEYLGLLDAHVSTKFKPGHRQEMLFVSRAGVASHFAGEAYLEKLMEQTGTRVIRPENMPLFEQLREYMSTECLCFSEGSAIHGLQLLGRCVGEVHILTRRPKDRGRSGFAENFIAPRAKKLLYIEAARGIIHGVTPLGQPEVWNGLSVFREDCLLNYISRLNSKISKRWKQPDYLEHRDADVRRWINQASNHYVSTIAKSREMIISKLNQLQLGHLIPYARAKLTSS